MSKRYYSLAQNGSTAEIDIYGDITSWPWVESDVSSYNLSQQLATLGNDVDVINVNINSYGGEVAEGIAIYNALKRHSAKIVTRCDGFACSIASVIFMAGDERIMHDASLLMVHNAWTYAAGNADELRKQAEDLDVMTGSCKAAYLSCVSISEEELTALMDSETWITPSDAVEYGFATGIETFDAKAPSLNARSAVFAKIAEREQAAAEPLTPAQPVVVPAMQETEPTDSTPSEQEKADIAFAAFLAAITEEKEN